MSDETAPDRTGIDRPLPDSLTVLVAGARNVDAGKTTVATGLVHSLVAFGVKPRAGNDFWYDYDAVSRELEAGRLVGSDARRLAAASKGSVEPEAINPLHRLWRPLDRGSGSIFGREQTEFLVDRVGGDYVVNATIDLPAAVTSSLPLEDAHRVESLEAMNALMADLHRPAVERVRPLLEGQDRVVIESYSDVARPLRDVRVDVVAVVGAGTLRLFDGERYCRAASVVSGGPDLGQLEERVANVVDLLDPIRRLDLAPLGSAARADPNAVAAAYADEFEAIVDAAR